MEDFHLTLCEEVSASTSGKMYSFTQSTSSLYHVSRGEYCQCLVHVPCEQLTVRIITAAWRGCCCSGPRCTRSR